MDHHAWRHMRASDADRERAADTIKAALAEGRIDWDEHGRRLTRVTNAQTYGDLEEVVHDLPSGITPFPRAPAPPPVHSPYGVPPPYLPVRRKTNELAVASVVCGALGFGTGITSIAAIITGHLALAKIRETGQEGRGLAVTGLALGYTVALGWFLFILFGIILVATV